MKSLLIKLSLVATLLFMSLVISGCDSDDDPAPPQKPEFAELLIDPIISEAMMGLTYYFNATAIDSNGVATNVNDRVIWSTEKSPAIMEFNTAFDPASPKTPFAKAVALGQDNIVATLGSLTATAVVNVIARPPVLSLIISPTHANVILNENQQYTVEGTFAGGITADVTTIATWTAATTGVTLTNFGLATPTLVRQNVAITAALDDQSDVATISGYTTEEISALRIDPNPAAFFPGSYRSFQAYATFTDGQEGNITHNSATSWGTEDIRIVDNGATSSPHEFLAGTILGSTNVTMSHPAGMAPSLLAPAKATAIVTAEVVSGIFLTPGDTAVIVGEEIQFSTVAGVANNTLFPIDGSPNLSYSSNKDTVAYFARDPRGKGRFITVGAGTVTVTATFTIAGVIYETDSIITVTAPAPAQ